VSQSEGKAPLNSRWIGFGLAALILGADQASKIWVVDHLMADGWRVIEVLPFFNLVMTWNPGVSFGMFGDGAIHPWMFLAFAAVLATALGVWLWRSPSRVLHIGLGLMIGGALGNGIDRARWGAVADFLDVHAFGWHFWAFNVADASISIGAVLLIIDSLFRRPS
jgi:signal peptidase II